ncbi:hypothetical protein QBC44DRAFT_375356 [Cladorrhinum sp. PSN332]|nr:hypothetical protein QBC44DRAFT_375356 [Cladorrhinum sp. PSN332]
MFQLPELERKPDPIPYTVRGPDSYRLLIPFNMPTEKGTECLIALSQTQETIFSSVLAFSIVGIIVVGAALCTMSLVRLISATLVRRFKPNNIRTTMESLSPHVDGGKQFRVVKCEKKDWHGHIDRLEEEGCARNWNLGKEGKKKATVKGRAERVMG